MKNKIIASGKIVFSLILIVFTLSLFPHLTQARIVNRVMAIVDNQIITSMNLRQTISVEYRQEDFQALPAKEQNAIIKKALDELIDNLLIARKAASLGINIGDEEVNETIERVLQQNRMDQETLEKALAAQNLNFTSYKSKIASDLLKAKFVSKEIRSNIIITNQEILNYAEKHDLLSTEESVTLAQIFIPASSSHAAAGKDDEIWKEIHERLKKDESFFTLASEYSEGPAAAKGGRLGTFKRGNLLAEIEDAAYEQPLNKPSKVIESSLGYHMIMVSNRTGKDEKRSLTPEAEEQVKERLYDEKLNQALKNMGRDLRREYSVKIMK
ncbi:MAG: peptidylprolyl isomerase [Pseudomonadota bacterium]|nr:peptidylprolyl isomerase [Pseudomonadota bacterium]